MVICVHLVYQLPIEVNQLLEFLLQQTSHAFLLPFFAFLLSLPGSQAQVSVDWVSRVKFKAAEGFLTSNAAGFAPTNFFDIRTPPRIATLKRVNDVVLEDESETIEAELFLARSCLIVAVALINQASFDFAHMTCSYLHKGNRWAFVKGQLLYPFAWISLLKVRLFFVFSHYLRSLIHLINIEIKNRPFKEAKNNKKCFYKCLMSAINGEPISKIK